METRGPSPSGRRSLAALAVLMGLALILAVSCGSPREEVEGGAPPPAPAPRGGPVPVKPATFLALSDVHYGSSATGSWYCRSCETDGALWTAAQTEAKSLVSKHDPSFVIYLGDLPAHNQGTKTRQSEFKTVLDGLQSIVAGTSTRLLYLPGNNDSVGSDYCAFTDQSQTPFDSATHPSDWPVINGQNDIINKKYLAQGYYSAFPLGTPAAGSTEPALRVITLNTVIFTNGYYDCVGGATQRQHSNDMLDWLGEQLAAATTSSGRKDKVILAMHVPPGWNGFGSHGNQQHMWDTKLDYDGKWVQQAEWVQRAFLELVNTYSSQIVGVLHSHTHLNGIRRIRNCSGDFIELGVSIPAVTTDHGSNPSMKLFTFGNGYELRDNETFYATHSSKDWSAGDSFTFRGNYPCSGCSSDATMKEWVEEIADAKLLQDMEAVLQVDSGQHLGGCCWGQALDVGCTK